jgi:hypothetical protein
MLARTELLQDGLSEASISSAFSKLRIATTGGVAFYYPDGPKYVHYICRHDAFAFYFGLGTFGMTAAEAAKAEKRLPQRGFVAKLPVALEVLLLAPKSPGKDAKLVHFDSPNPNDPHTSHNIFTYLEHVKPFDEIYGQ